MLTRAVSEKRVEVITISFRKVQKMIINLKTEEKPTRTAIVLE